MTKAEMEVAIEQHARTVNGNRHRFRVRWAALEPRWSSTGARCLLAIDVCPEGGATGLWTTLHILTYATTTREQLLGLVNDALDENLREHGSDPSTAVDSNEGLADGVAENDARGADAHDLVLTARLDSRR